MPLRMQMSRPVYVTRALRPLRQPAPRAPAAGRRSAAPSPSTAAFAPIDTTPTGDPGTDIVKAINAAVQQNRQNALANRLMNTETPPRAGLVGPGINPQTGQPNPAMAPTAGSAPITGGTQELAFRQQLAADQEAQNQQALADQMKRAQIAKAWGAARGGGGGGDGAGSGVGSASRWKQQAAGQQQPGGGKAGKPPPLVPNQYNATTDSRADSFPQMQADFDAQYGKGSYAKVMPNLGTATTDDKGNTVIGSPDKPIMTLSPDQTNYWLNRYNAGLVNSGQSPARITVPGANPNSGQGAGTVANPYAPKTGLEVRALPYNSYFVDPQSGQTGQKLPVQQQPLTQQPQQPPPTSAADTGAQTDNLGNLGDESLIDQTDTSQSGALFNPQDQWS